MAEIGDGYGSEWHLLRYLGRHRDDLDRRVSVETGATSVRWRDFPFDSEKPRLDREWEGLEFLPLRHPARLAWAQYWPQSGTQQNWDAVGQAKIDGADEWLLIEAKAHLVLWRQRSWRIAENSKGVLRFEARTPRGGGSRLAQ